MATVYKIEIETCSAWNNYPFTYIEQELRAWLEDKKELGMESTEIKVTQK